MNVLIYGAGAIGCHVGYCMYVTGHNVHLVARGEHFRQMKKNGLHIKICDNDIVETEKVIKENERFHILSDLSQLSSDSMEYVFITIKMYDYNERSVESLVEVMGHNTSVITPCTRIPFWWLNGLVEENILKNNGLVSDFEPELSKYFRVENIIGMTMWLSAVIDEPGTVCVRHVQRGYPVKEIHPRMRARADKLRNVFKKACLSPPVEDIRAEIFSKSLNALAFNVVALDTEYSNIELEKDSYSLDSIRRIMEEGEQISDSLGIELSQNIESRIKQTLSSTAHTMSMLTDYKRGRRIELESLWDSFRKVSDMLELELAFTESLINRVLGKIESQREFESVASTG